MIDAPVFSLTESV